MIDKIRKSLNKGLDQVRWIATFLAERTKAETEIARLLFENTKIEGRIDDLHRDIGRRVSELKGQGEKSVWKDFIIRQALDEIKHLREAADNYKSQADNLNKLPE
jgi:predicted RNase H-like nuclease (RuvC/YqgF family)